MLWLLTWWFCRTFNSGNISEPLFPDLGTLFLQLGCLVWLDIMVWAFSYYILFLHGWLISLGGVIFSEVKKGGSRSEGDKRQRGLKGKEAKDIVIGMHYMREEWIKWKKRKYSAHVSKILVLLFPESNGLELFLWSPKYQ